MYPHQAFTPIPIAIVIIILSIIFTITEYYHYQQPSYHKTDREYPPTAKMQDRL